MTFEMDAPGTTVTKSSSTAPVKIQSDAADQKAGLISDDKLLNRKKPRVNKPKPKETKKIAIEAGYDSDVVKAKKKKKVLELPESSSLPYDYLKTNEPRLTVSLHGPERVTGELLKLREQYQQPTWVILNMLLDHFKNTHPKGQS